MCNQSIFRLIFEFCNLMSFRHKIIICVTLFLMLSYKNADINEYILVGLQPPGPVCVTSGRISTMSNSSCPCAVLGALLHHFGWLLLEFPWNGTPRMELLGNGTGKAAEVELCHLLKFSLKKLPLLCV